MKVHVKKHERGLHFRRGEFFRLLGPGEHRIWASLVEPGAHVVEIHNTLETLFTHPLRDVLVKEDVLKAELHVLELGDAERALVWKDERLAYFFGPGRHALWKEPYALRFETFKVDDFRFQHPRVDVVLAHAAAEMWLQELVVQPHEEVLLFRNGVLADRLGAGRHVVWKQAGRLAWKLVDGREQIADVAGQEILTSDKVTLRINLVVTYRIVDAVKATTTVVDAAQAVYREAQLALRAAVGTRTLDALLADKEAIGAEVRRALEGRAAEFGVAVRGVGVRDLILPGDMKEILNQVITAEKQAQANLIKRREETAAARSQANTAKLLAENPMLARLKELELLQEILAGAKATFVFGDGDLTARLRGLIGGKHALDEGG